MSIHPQPVPEIPALTTKVARAAFPKGNVYMQMRDVFGTFFQDDQFTDLYARDGQSGFSPWRLALVCVMQFAENLTDRQAANAVRARIDWKYALSLELDDPGFDFSILSEFRQRLIDSPDMERVFNRLLETFQTRGLLQGGGRQRTDSTRIFSATRRLNHLESVGQTLYHALNILAVEAPDWLTAWVLPDWYERYGQPFNDYNLPKDKTEQQELALIIGRDGLRLLDALWNDVQAPPHLKQLRAIETLHQVWIQHYYLENDEVYWRERKDMPPAEQLLQSPFDVEARYSSKRNVEWVGYKVHLTETCDEDSPNLITHIETTLATEPDNMVVDPIHQALYKKRCLPRQHIVDSGYTSAALLVNSLRDYGVELIGPLVNPAGWQARANTGFDLSAFKIDWDTQVVTCPMGKTSRSWSSIPHLRGHEFIMVHFSSKDCRICPSKQMCTRAPRRTLGLHPKAVFEMVQARRSEQDTEVFRSIYRKRNGVEGSISQACLVLGMRRTRYRGLAKTHLQNLLTAAAINLTRAMNWLAGIPKATTRVSPFAALALAS